MGSQVGIALRGLARFLITCGVHMAAPTLCAPVEIHPGVWRCRVCGADTSPAKERS